MLPTGERSLNQSSQLISSYGENSASGFERINLGDFFIFSSL
jgi:hypothetical protein